MMNNDAFSQIQGVLMPRRQHSDSELSPEQLLIKSRVTPTTELPPMEPLFRMYDVPCFYRGELVAVCGKAKSGKTLFLSVIMAACLTSKILALERATEAPIKVLWIDTEQSQQSTQDIMVKRIIPLARAPSETFDDTFFAFNLRGLGFEKRRQLVEVAIATVKPDLVIVDGIKDLMTDINDAVQATLIMEQLMALAQAHHCCIVNVLHQNKSEADHNMRGSIGTELTNKAFEVYTCEYVEERDTFKVSQRLSRRERIKQKLTYQLSDDGLPVECSDVVEQPRDEQGRWVSTKVVLPETDTDLRKLFTDAMEGRTQRPFSEVMGIALKHYGVANAKMFYACVDKALEQGIIRKAIHPETGRSWLEILDEQLPF